MKKYSTLIIVLILLLSIFGSNLYAGTYSGGTGESNNPYQIADANDLLALSADTNDYAKCFILVADVNMVGRLFTTAIIAADMVDDSDSYFVTPAFTGTFDGNGHKVTNFTINGGNLLYLGLFGRINSGGSVKNLGLENFSATGSNLVGGLVAYNMDGSISGCYSTGTVSGNTAGGLVGYNMDGSISNCYSTGMVDGVTAVGGLVGHNEGSIGCCYSTSAVSVFFSYAGGLVGGNTGFISDCYSTGTVSGSHFGSGNIAGLVGGNTGFISNCYSIGPVSGSYHSRGVGGLVGSNYTGNVSSSFWDTQTSSQTTSDGGIGNTTEEMQTLATFLDAGWDFVCETANGTDDIWFMPPDDYPHLTWELPPEFNLSVSPTILWPANNKMVKIRPIWTATDLCDPSPKVSLVHITANESCNPDDIKIDPDGLIQLCATRSGNSKGRIYTLTYEACDSSANCTTKTATVTVPHDNRK